MPHQSQQILQLVTPVVQHGLKELAVTSATHTLYEAAAVGFLMGRGYDYSTALRIVESWEKNESLPAPLPEYAHEFPPQAVQPGPALHAGTHASPYPGPYPGLHPASYPGSFPGV
jgi:hypothetical protein